MKSELKIHPITLKSRKHLIYLPKNKQFRSSSEKKKDYLETIKRINFSKEFF